MRAGLARLQKNRVQLEVEVATEQVSKALDQAYRRVVRRVNIPGFRKGKAPRSILERHIGKGPIFEEAAEILVQEAYPAAVAETAIEPITQPELDLVQLEEGKPFIFKATVEVKPEVTLGQYKNLPVTKQIKTIKDEDVDAVLNDLREHHSELVAIDKPEVEKGDFVVLDFEGFLDGKPFGGGSAKDYLLEIGGGQFIPGFEDQLVGAKPGVEKEIVVTFPADYNAKQLAGREATFKVTIREIKKKVLSELDDEFAKDVSDFSTLAELKDNIRKRLQEDVERAANAAVEEKLVETVTANAQVDVPEVLRDRRVERQMEEFAQRLLYNGLKLEDLFAAGKMDEEKLREEFKPKAEQEVKASLVLEAIARAEAITPSDQEIDRRIEEMAADQREDVAQLKERLGPEGRESVADRIRIQKTIDFLVQNATITVENV
ncbi:MAG: trigger factor [Syntrophothermus sp.]